MEANQGSLQARPAVDSGDPAIGFAGSLEALGCLAAPGPLSGRRWSGPERQQLDSGQLGLAAGAWQWRLMAVDFPSCSPLSERAATVLELGFPSLVASD